MLKRAKKEVSVSSVTYLAIIFSLPLSANCFWAKWTDLDHLKPNVRRTAVGERLERWVQTSKNIPSDRLRTRWGSRALGKAEGQDPSENVEDKAFSKPPDHTDQERPFEVHGVALSETSQSGTKRSVPYSQQEGAAFETRKGKPPTSDDALTLQWSAGSPAWKKQHPVGFKEPWKPVTSPTSDAPVQETRGTTWTDPDTGAPENATKTRSAPSFRSNREPVMNPDRPPDGSNRDGMLDQVSFHDGDGDEEVYPSSGSRRRTRVETPRLSEHSVTPGNQQNHQVAVFNNQRSYGNNQQNRPVVMSDNHGIHDNGQQTHQTVKSGNDRLYGNSPQTHQAVTSYNNRPYDSGLWSQHLAPSNNYNLHDNSRQAYRAVISSRYLHDSSSLFHQNTRPENADNAAGVATLQLASPQDQHHQPRVSSDLVNWAHPDIRNSKGLLSLVSPLSKFPSQTSDVIDALARYMIIRNSLGGQQPREPVLDPSRYGDLSLYGDQSRYDGCHAVCARSFQSAMPESGPSDNFKRTLTIILWTTLAVLGAGMTVSGGRANNDGPIADFCNMVDCRRAATLLFGAERMAQLEHTYQRLVPGIADMRSEVDTTRHVRSLKSRKGDAGSASDPVHRGIPSAGQGDLSRASTTSGYGPELRSRVVEEAVDNGQRPTSAKSAESNGMETGPHKQDAVVNSAGGISGFSEMSSAGVAQGRAIRYPTLKDQVRRAWRRIASIPQHVARYVKNSMRRRAPRMRDHPPVEQTPSTLVPATVTHAPNHPPDRPASVTRPDLTQRLLDLGARPVDWANCGCQRRSVHGGYLGGEHLGLAVGAFLSTSFWIPALGLVYLLGSNSYSHGHHYVREPDVDTETITISDTDVSNHTNEDNDVLTNSAPTDIINDPTNTNTETQINTDYVDITVTDDSNTSNTIGDNTNEATNTNINYDDDDCDDDCDPPDTRDLV